MCAPRPRRPFLAALIVLTCAAPAAAQEGVPFDGAFDGQIVANSGNHFTALDIGEATHIGRFSAVQTYDFSSLTDFTGSIVFVAANGDTLHGTFAGVDTP